MSVRGPGLLTVLALAVPGLVGAAPPELTHLLPSGTTRGTEQSVVLRGSFSGGDQRRTWASHPGLLLTPGKKQSEVKVVVKETVLPGRYWVRLANAEGASALRPFFVSGVPEVSEKEPNNSVREAQKLDGERHVVNGVLGKTGDVDTFAIFLKKGQSVVAAMAANGPLGSPMDGLLQVVTPRGFVVAQNDDASGLDPLVAWTARRDGACLVRAFAFPSKTNSSIRLAGGDNFIYRLTLTSGPFIDYSMPLAVSREKPSTVALFGWNLEEPSKQRQVNLAEPGDRLVSRTRDRLVVFDPRWGNTLSVKQVDHAVAVEKEPNSREVPQQIKIPVTICGRIGEAKDLDVFEFEAKKGQPLQLVVESRRLGFPLDPVLRVTGATGKVIQETETRSADKIDESLTWTPPADGRFRVEVGDLFQHGGARYAYRLTIAPVKARATVTVEKDRWELVGEKPQEIKLTIARSGGYSQSIRFEAVELPPGVEAAPVVSEPKGDSAKSVTLKLTKKADAGNDGGGPLRIVGRVEGVKDAVVTTAAIEGLQERTPHLWLTFKPAAKKDKKKDKK